MRLIKSVSVLFAAFALIACDGVNESLDLGADEVRKESFSTVNGNVKVGVNAEVDGDIELVNGSVTLARGARAESIETVNGPVSLDEKAKVESIETVNGSVEIAASGQVEKDIETVNGHISLAQDVEVDDIVAVNGLIELFGAHVKGDVSNYNGGMHLDAGATVYGDVKVQKPDNGWSNSTPIIVIGKDVVIKGNLDVERPIKLYVHESAEIGRLQGAEAETYTSEQPPATP